MNDETGQNHLEAVGELLSRDHLARADLGEALHDLAGVIRRTVRAQEALVAIWYPDRRGWEAVASNGRRMREGEIARIGSRAVLDRVRESGEPLLTVGDLKMPISSRSVHRHRIRGVLAVPLHWWDVTANHPERQFGGCVYAHRTAGRDPFTDGDVRTVTTLARLSEPLLNVLRYLQDVTEQLQRVEHEAAELRQASTASFPFGEEQLGLPADTFATLRRVVEHDRVTMLITGPTGAGKTHLARAYHHACPRRDRPFVVLDCASVTSAETLGAELFGYAADSGYANAPARGRPGKARLADGGTLFVDEVGSLSAELQPRLLRLIEEGRLSPLGSSTEEETDIQVVAATSRDLTEAIDRGTFRADLYHRLAVVRIDLPGLSDRTSEIPELTRTLLGRICDEAGRGPLRLTDGAIRAIVRHDWDQDGNIRGLANLLRRSVWAASKTQHSLSAKDLRWLSSRRRTAALAAHRRTVPTSPSTDIDIERIKRAIRNHGTGAAAAAALGLTYRQLYWRLERAGLNVRRAMLDE